MKFFHEWKQEKVKKLQDEIKRLDSREEEYNLVYDVITELQAEGFYVSDGYFSTTISIWPENVNQVPFIIEAISDLVEEYELKVTADWTFLEHDGWWCLVTDHLTFDVVVSGVCKRVKVGQKTVDDEIYICGPQN